MINIIGIILFILGFLIRILGFISIKDKNYWRIIAKSSFVDNGVYKYIRHPMYCGSLIMFLGLSIIFIDNLFISFFLITLLLNFFLDRIDREEQLMILNNGNKYIDYMNKTKIFIPFII